jgi:glycerol-3-phosphate dehydrogenase
VTQDETIHDILIIGGGINGCGIARDAAGRGYSVCLAEMNDLASGTSSWSTKLVHGGLRYLEHYEFRLVRESLKEREVLWSMAPHIIKPLRFILPHHSGLRPAWLLRLGLFLYDHLGGRKALPPTRVVPLSDGPFRQGLKALFKRGFEYSDCWVDDARLVVLNACDAAARGAEIMTRTKVTACRRDGDVWVAELTDAHTGETSTRRARMIVNAAGPWVDTVLGRVVRSNNARNVRLVQGSHIVVPRLFDHDRCFIFQNTDGRIVFAIPYEDDFTLIGTTDRDYSGDAVDAAISDDEIDYLCAAVSEYLETPVTRADIVWTYSGVRPLFDDGASAAQAATRDYVLREEPAFTDGSAPLLNIFGGKITTYRRLAASVLERIEKRLGRHGPAWTHQALPGGEFAIGEFDSVKQQLKSDYPFLDDRHVHRLVRLYGTACWTLLGTAKTADDLGRRFGHDLSEAEVRYLMTHEWAMTADDVLWRRTKLGLRLNAQEKQALSEFMTAAHAIVDAAAQ